MNGRRAEPPLVSIGMAVRNNERTVAQAVRSILWQSYPRWELILIDDGSTDDTLAVIREFADDRIRVVTDVASRGLSDRLNQAIALSRGDYFARMDGDDVSYPERLERQLAYLEQRPDVDLVGASTLVFRAQGDIVGKRPSPESHDAIVARPHAGIAISHPTFFGRIEFFCRHAYRPAAHLWEDQDLLLRAYRHSRFANVPAILLGYREESLALTKLLTMRRHYAYGLGKAYCARRRPDLAARAVSGQAARAAVDVAAIWTGLDYRVLRHRARSASAAERAEWEYVWSNLLGETEPDHRRA